MKLTRLAAGCHCATHNPGSKSSVHPAFREPSAFARSQSSTTQALNTACPHRTKTVGLFVRGVWTETCCTTTSHRTPTPTHLLEVGWLRPHRELCGDATSTHSTHFITSNAHPPSSNEPHPTQQEQDFVARAPSQSTHCVNS